MNYELFRFKKQKSNYKLKKEQSKKNVGKWCVERILVNGEVQFLDECHKSYFLKIDEFGTFYQAFSDSKTYCKTEIDSINYIKVIQLGDKTLFRSASHEILGNKGDIFTFENNIIFTFKKPFLYMYKFELQNEKLVFRNNESEIVLMKSD